MIGDKSVDELLPLLQLNETEIQRIATLTLSKIQGNKSISELLLLIADVLYKKADKKAGQVVQSATAEAESPLSYSIAKKKMSAHYFRWKYAYKYSKHTGMDKIREYVKEHFKLEDDFFKEVAHLFTVCLNLGVHTLAIPYIGINSIKLSLKLYSLNEETVISTVEALYCTLID